MAIEDLAFQQAEPKGMAPYFGIISLHMSQDCLDNPWKCGMLFSGCVHDFYLSLHEMRIWSGTARMDTEIMLIVCKQMCRNSF